MTLDEQINLMEELLSDDDHWSCENAKTDYRQLQEWLKDYKRLLEMPKGDLISREALKKEIIELDLDNTSHWSVIYKIDNAPTVEIPTELCKGCRFLKDCEICEEKLRPHWIKIFENQYTNGYVCSVCGHEIHVTEQFLPKVTECEGCGADMQKGGAENDIHSDIESP